MIEHQKLLFGTGMRLSGPVAMVLVWCSTWRLRRTLCMVEVTLSRYTKFLFEKKIIFESVFLGVVYNTIYLSKMQQEDI